jgi:hypothetical protein
MLRLEQTVAFCHHRPIAPCLHQNRPKSYAADWLAPETKQNALHKLEALDPRIGYPVKRRDY